MRQKMSASKETPIQIASSFIINHLPLLTPRVSRGVTPNVVDFRHFLVRFPGLKQRSIFVEDKKQGEYQKNNSLFVHFKTWSTSTLEKSITAASIGRQKYRGGETVDNWCKQEDGRIIHFLWTTKLFLCFFLALFFFRENLEKLNGGKQWRAGWHKKVPRRKFAFKSVGKREKFWVMAHNAYSYVKERMNKLLAMPICLGRNREDQEKDLVVKGEKHGGRHDLDKVKFWELRLLTQICECHSDRM